MADEKPTEKAEEKGGKTPPTTPDIVSDNHQKQIRELQEKISGNETTMQTMAAELKSTREMFEKMSKLPAPTTSTTTEPKKKSLLDFVNDIVAGNF